mgnify:CR=1 FL=1
MEEGSGIEPQAIFQPVTLSRRTPSPSGITLHILTLQLGILQD